MDNNINILDELHKGSLMGINALDFILPKVKEESFKTLLEKQKKEYKNIAKRISGLYKKYTTDTIQETGMMEKIMTWYGVQKDTMMDNSVSKIADLLIKGTNMGIVEGKKILNHKTMDKKVHKLCSEYITMQEDYLDRLKAFL